MTELPIEGSARPSAETLKSTLKYHSLVPRLSPRVKMECWAGLGNEARNVKFYTENLILRKDVFVAEIVWTLCNTSRIQTSVLRWVT